MNLLLPSGPSSWEMEGEWQVSWGGDVDRKVGGVGAWTERGRWEAWGSGRYIVGEGGDVEVGRVRVWTGRWERGHREGGGEGEGVAGRWGW